MKKACYLIWLVLIGLQLTLYYFLFRELVEAAYQEKAPVWFNKLIQAVYPRFMVEKHRFDLHFFLQKADQVIWRFCGLQVLVLAGMYGYRFSSGFRQKFMHFWQKPASVSHVRILSVLFYSGMIFFTYEWYDYLSDLSKANAFYKPLLLLRWLHLGFPFNQLLRMLCVLLWVACVCVVAKVKPVWSASVASILFIVLQGWLYSFEKLDHTFSTFTYAALVMPFLLSSQQQAVWQQQDYFNGWALQLIRVCIALAYGMAGLEKILISGWHWVDANTFRAYIYLHQAPLGIQVAQIQWLCVILPVLALIFQLGFIGILFFRNYTFLFLLAGITFHISTYLLLGVGGYANAWIFVYIFFINWQKAAFIRYSL